MTNQTANSAEIVALPSHEFSIGEIAGSIDTLQLDQVSAGGGFYPAQWYRDHGKDPSPPISTVVGPVVAIAAGVVVVVV